MDSQAAPVVIGTAGHIDHGKTTLVKALTGQDADRLPEEKQRGITIDLGFAHMTLPSGRQIAFIDVPGHERFVRNMVAGVHGMDGVILVVAADEGIMPQTVEHLAILRLLGVEQGLVVITKADAVEPEMVELVRAIVEEACAGTFLEGSPIVVTDALTGRGLDRLVGHLEQLAERAARPGSGGLVRLPIDRVFSVRGFGTVVTGTLVSGEMAIDDTLELVPAKRMVRVRGLQVHNHTVKTVSAGRRVAVNVAGVDRDEVSRGDVLATAGTLEGVWVMTAAIELLESSPPLAEHTRVHLHAGTAEALGRVYWFDRKQLEPGAQAFGEIRLESAIPLTRRDRVLLRSYSPVLTIGGGIVLEVGLHHKKTEPGLMERLHRLHQGSDEAILEALAAQSSRPLEMSAAASRLGVTPEDLARWVAENPELVNWDKRWLWHRAALNAWLERVRRQVAGYSAEHPVKPGMPIDLLKARVAADWSLRSFRAALTAPEIVVDREWVRLTPEPLPLSRSWQEALDRLYALIDRGGLRPDSLEHIQAELGESKESFEDLLERLYLEGRVLRLEDGLAISRQSFLQGEQLVREALAARGPTSTGDLKEILGVNRRSAVLFLELLDREKVTRRVGDNRELVG